METQTRRSHAEMGGTRGPFEWLAWTLAVVVLILQLWAINAQSMSGDGAYHLLAGHQALRYGQNTLNLEHPPLVKLLVSLPLLAEDDPLAPPVKVEQAIAESARVYEDPDRLRRVTWRGRSIALTVFALPLMIGVWFLGRHFAGDRGGWLLILMLGLSFSIVPILSSLQTDTAVTCAGVWLLLAAFRYLTAPHWRWAIVMGLALGVAMASKFSGTLLVATVVAAVLLAPNLRTRWRARLGELVVAAVVALAVIHLVQAAGNRRYDSETGRTVITSYCHDDGTLLVKDRLEWAAPPLLALERVDPLLAQWLTGMLGVRAQNAEGAYLSYAFGSVSRWGRWWYFPVLLTTKTPLILLLIAGAVLAGTTRTGGARPKFSRPGILLLITVSVYLATAITSNYNLGYRHLLPILPVLLVPLVRWLAPRTRTAAVVLLILALEAVVVGPHWMSATNTWWLGSVNPTRFVLGAGNTEYRQNFISLAREIEDRGIGGVTLLYPTLPAEVVDAYLPGSRAIELGDAITPGWYAVNVMVEQLVPSVLAAPVDDLPQPGIKPIAEQWSAIWNEVREGEDHGYIAGTFRLYRLAPEPTDILGP